LHFVFCDLYPHWLWLQISEIPDCLAIAIGPRSIPSATDTDGGLLY
jgi:hypothetical protein